MVSDPRKQRRDWPDHPTAPLEHIHAIGVLSLNYNEMETQLLSLIQCYDTTSPPVASFLFEKVPTNVRIEWLKLIIPENIVSTPLHEAISSFIAAYSRCTDNRGLLVHSRVWAYRASDDVIITSKRARNSGEERSYEFPLDVIRRVADEIQFWGRYCGILNAYINRSHLSRKRLPKGVLLAGC